MPDITIDGTSVSGITIDGTDVQEVTIDGSVAWTAVTTIDDFEDGDIAEYGGDTGAFSATTNLAYNGSYGCEQSSSSNYNAISDTGPSLSQGDTITSWHNSAGDVSSILVFAQSETGISNMSAYEARIKPSANELLLMRRDSGSGTTLSSASVSLSANTWYQLEVATATDDTIIVTCYDDTGTQLKQISATDANYISGGIGVAGYNSQTVDYIQKK